MWRKKGKEKNASEVRHLRYLAGMNHSQSFEKKKTSGKPKTEIWNEQSAV